MPEFTKEERRILNKIRTPARIQDFLDTLAINHEKQGETCYSPRLVLRYKKAHCLEGALLAAVALAQTGQPPLVMNLHTGNGDDDHTVALFKNNGCWGALSKTNHAVLRYRDPIYRTLRELALSYFHEYFLDDGRKTLRSYSKPVNVNRFGTAWITSEEPLWRIADALQDAPHSPLIPPSARARLRRAHPLERKVFKTVEWPKNDSRT